MAARRFPVESGHVLMFARSLGAADPDGDHLTFVWSDSTGTSHFSGQTDAGTGASATAASNPGYRESYRCRLA